MPTATAQSLSKLPPYLFVEIDKAKRQAREQGKDLIDLGIGDPDTATPAHIIEALYQAAKNPANHRYALDAGLLELRKEISQWSQDRFGVALDPAHEILPLIGSKEGIAHLPFAYLNRGDVTLVPDPSYPPYRNTTMLAGGKPYLMPLRDKNDFLPDLKAIPAKVLSRAKIVYLNYPNNPTSATAPLPFLQEAVALAQRHNLIICSDLAYSEMTYDGYRAPSIFQVAGAKDVAIEFHSFSKTFNMTGWRLGWACGCKEIVAALGKIKSNIDSGVFQAIQVTGIAALRTERGFIDRMNAMYQERRDILCGGLKKLGWKFRLPQATFYVWARVPGRKKDSLTFAKLVLDKTGIVATPGVGFGACGEGYIRFALTQPNDRLQEAVQRLAGI